MGRALGIAVLLAVLGAARLAEGQASACVDGGIVAIASGAGALANATAGSGAAAVGGKQAVNCTWVLGFPGALTQLSQIVTSGDPASTSVTIYGAAA